MKNKLVCLSFLSVVVGILTSSYLTNPHPVKLIMKQHMDSSSSEAFKVWHFLHKKDYEINSDEGLKRFKNFKKNFEIVKSHNQNGEKNYSIGLNNFADLTIDEFKTQYLEGNGNLFKKLKETKVANNKTYSSFWDVPEDEEDEYIELFLNKNKKSKLLMTSPFVKNVEFKSIDWVEKAQLKNNVENQKDCGSCWAFATSQAVQAAYTLKTGKSVRFSKQQLVDCDSKSHGCSGGMIDVAMEYVKKNGLETEEDYSYTGNVGTCSYSKDKIVTKVSSYESCAEDDHCANDESLFKSLLKGPVAAAVDASEEFMLYEDGIFDKPCSELNHAILLIGYHLKESDSDNSYWLVKNSWGKMWGLQGYIKIKHSKDYNSCLLNKYYVRPDI